MQLDLDRTIAAIGSGIAPSERIILRLSGPATRQILSCVVTSNELPELFGQERPWSSQVRCRLGWGDRTVAVQLYFWPDARSYTGEPSAELHVVGSIPVAESLLGLLIQHGASPAERGEFTLRSFLAGKMDLTQAEAVLGVIEADNQSTLDWALGQLGGNLATPVRAFQRSLIDLLAHLEAGLDFVEEDIAFVSEEELTQSVQQLALSISNLAQQLVSREVRTRSLSVALVGAPNAGKSSLFNALVGSNRAITSPEAGTTRDAVSQTADFHSLRVELIDTAGIEELGDGTPRAIAQRVAMRKVAESDLLLYCRDLSSDASIADQHEIAQLKQLNASILVVGTKLDLASDLPANENELPVHCSVTIKDPVTLDDLKRIVRDRLANLIEAKGSEAMHYAVVRSTQSLHLATEALRRALEAIQLRTGEEFVAAELRNALDALSAILGEVHSDDILGEIFSRFCIGK